MSGHYDDAIDLAVEAAAHASALSDKVSQALAFQRYRTFYPIPSGFSYVNSLQVDCRGVGQYLARHVPSTFDQMTALRNGAARTKLAQSFQVSESNPVFVLGDAYFLMAQVGTITGTDTLTLTVEEDNAGEPDGTALATAVISPTSLPTEPGFQRFDFTSNPTLVDNRTYWLVLSGAFDMSGTNYVGVALDGDAGYANGDFKYNDGASWVAFDGSLVFTVRTPYSRLETLKPRVHWTVSRDTTRSIVLTEAAIENFGLLDGAVFYLSGQGAPALPTSDSSTLEIPYGYAVARAGMHLAMSFKDYMGGRASEAISAWGRVVDDLEDKMNPGVRPGSIEVEGL